MRAHEQQKEDEHFLKVWRDSIHIDQSSDILMICEMPQKCDLAKSPLGKLGLLKYPCYQLDGHCLARYLIRRRPRYARVRWALPYSISHLSANVHDYPVRARPHFSDELPPLLHMEHLPKGRHERMVSPANCVSPRQAFH